MSSLKGSNDFLRTAATVLVSFDAELCEGTLSFFYFFIFFAPYTVLAEESLRKSGVL